MKALSSLGILGFLSLAPMRPEISAEAAAIAPEWYQAMEWRSLGPFRGGRVTAVAGAPDEPHTFFFGASGGGVWKTEDAGNTWRNVSDTHFRTGSIGAIAIAPSDRNVIYVGTGEGPTRGQTSTDGDGLYKSTDGGLTWSPIGLEKAGRIPRIRIHPRNADFVYAAAQGYNTVSYRVESPHQAGTLWVGSDDGLVHLTRDGGGRWESVTPSGLDEAKVNAIEVSPHDPASAYLAVTRFLLGDPKPYVLKTSDYGKSWKSIVAGIGDAEPVRVVREDPGRRGLLYAGTERGVHVSFDDGADWQSLQFNLPAVPVTDLTIRRGDLVASTEGRGFWILDDLTPLQQMNETLTGRSAHLFAPRKAYRTPGSAPLVSGAGRNAPAGAILYYHLAQVAGEEVRLEISDAAGERIRRFAPPPLRAGMNRLVWDLRHEDAVRVPGTFMAADFFGTVPGRRVPPGSYRVELVLGDVRFAEALEVVSDPRVEVTADDFREQEELLAAISRSIDDIHRSIAAMQRVRDQVESAAGRAAGLPSAGEIEEAGDRLEEAITGWEEKLIQTRLETIMDAVNFPTRLNEQFLFLKGAVASADARPTAPHRERFEELEADWAARREEMKLLLDEVARFNDLLRRTDVPAVAPPWNERDGAKNRFRASCAPAGSA